MTIVPHVCRGRPLFRGLVGCLRVRLPGSNTDCLTGSLPARLASCPKKVICRLTMSSLSGRSLATPSTALFDTRLI
eukprot:8191814-Pyramimonas_sp.AAC.1